MISDRREVLALVESGWGKAPVLVVGDVMLDQYVWGEVERISPEAPVPVVRTSSREEKPGGAANVAMNLAGLGACVSLVGFAGGDDEHNKLESLLAVEGIEPFLTAVPRVPTTTKLRVLAGNQQMMRLDREAAAAFSEANYADLLRCVFAALPDVSVVVLSDYAKGALSEEVCQAVIDRARSLHLPVLVDPKSRSFTRYRGATAICPNLKELSAATGEPASDVDRLLKAAQGHLPSLQIDYMVVTLGAGGIAVLRRDSCLRVPAIVRQVYDVSGAGDTVIAILALATACGVDLETAAELANTAAGIVVGKVGTVPIRREELLGVLSGEITLCMDDKVVDLDELMARIAGWRAAGQRMVFTNGCFDLLHIGHVRLLEQARREGDRLIIGLNSDESVRRLKGPERPVVAQAERGQILAALSAVDAVVIFEDDNPLRLIEAIRPDVLVKGGDYSEKSVVGAREVRAWGGRVALIPLVEGVSSTRLVANSAGASRKTVAKSLSA